MGAGREARRGARGPAARGAAGARRAARALRGALSSHPLHARFQRRRNFVSVELNYVSRRALCGVCNRLALAAGGWGDGLAQRRRRGGVGRGARARARARAAARCWRRAARAGGGAEGLGDGPLARAAGRGRERGGRGGEEEHGRRRKHGQRGAARARAGARPARPAARPVARARRVRAHGIRHGPLNHPRAPHRARRACGGMRQDEPTRRAAPRCPCRPAFCCNGSTVTAILWCHKTNPASVVPEGGEVATERLNRVARRERVGDRTVEQTIARCINVVIDQRGSRAVGSARSDAGVPGACAFCCGCAPGALGAATAAAATADPGVFSASPHRALVTHTPGCLGGRQTRAVGLCSSSARPGPGGMGRQPSAATQPALRYSRVATQTMRAARCARGFHRSTADLLTTPPPPPPPLPVRWRHEAHLPRPHAPAPAARGACSPAVAEPRPFSDAQVPPYTLSCLQRRRPPSGAPDRACLPAACQVSAARRTGGAVRAVLSRVGLRAVVLACEGGGCACRGPLRS